MADECEEDFLCMGLSSDEDGATAEAEKKVPRDFQSQEDYEKQKAEWKPKVEKGEVSLNHRWLCSGCKGSLS